MRETYAFLEPLNNKSTKRGFKFRENGEKEGAHLYSMNVFTIKLIQFAEIMEGDFYRAISYRRFDTELMKQLNSTLILNVKKRRDNQASIVLALFTWILTRAQAFLFSILSNSIFSETYIFTRLR